ncbi:hypothetical protein QUF63_11305 [Anaerolineales bacterium HSG25]|nr:hypothetical protein [Anaerolineales bacterium HSG25]
MNFIKYLLYREQLEPKSVERSTTAEDDPLLQLVGLGSSDFHDLSTRHDNHLAELELGDQHAPSKSR